MTTKLKTDTHEPAIDQILDSVRELLEEHYAAAARLPDARNRVKIAFSVVIDNREIETTCTYGRRHKATSERYIDDPDQIKLNLERGNGTDN